MADDNVTQNIYTSWYSVLGRKGSSYAMSPIKSLSSLSLEEIDHLIWMLQEETRVRSNKK